MTTHAMPMTDTLTRGGLRRRLLATERDWGATVARVALGAVMFPHGAQKLLGWFGGYGFRGTMGFLTAQVGLPYPIALLVIPARSRSSSDWRAGSRRRAWWPSWWAPSSPCTSTTASS